MIFVVLVALGLCAGSFVNALVWRIHAQFKSKKPRKDLSILHGRSMCTHCHHRLEWYDLIPVISWLMLRGACRYCKKPISVQYPAVEISVALLFVLSFVVWPKPLQDAELLAFISWLMVLPGLIALFIYDLRWMLLPNRILFPLFGPAVIFAITTIIKNPNHLEATFNVLLALLLIGGLFWCLFQVSKGTWIGGGDVKLGFLLGLLAGQPSQSALIIFVSSLLGTIVSLPLLLTHRAKITSRLAFGPFLISGGILVVLYGERILSWYNHFLILN